MKNRLLIIVNEENTNIHEILEQLSNMNKIVIPKKETTDESLSFYSSFYNLLSKEEFASLINSDGKVKIKSFAHTTNGLMGYKPNTIGQSYVDLYNGMGRIMILFISKEELPFYSHYYNSATFVGLVNSNSASIAEMSKLLDSVIVADDESLEQFNAIIENIIANNPVVYEKK